MAASNRDAARGEPGLLARDYLLDGNTRLHPLNPLEERMRRRYIGKRSGGRVSKRTIGRRTQPGPGDKYRNLRAGNPIVRAILAASTTRRDSQLVHLLNPLKSKCLGAHVAKVGEPE